MKWIVFKQNGAGFDSFGPIIAETAQEACNDLAEGRGQTEGYYTRLVGLPTPTYGAQGRGRYFAVPLDDWQDGVFDYTAARGIEPVFSDS